METGAGRTQPNGREFTSDLESVGAARDLVRESLAGASVEDDAIRDIQLAVSELVTNAVVHGNGGPVFVGVDVSAGAIECSVSAGLSDTTLPDPAMWAAPARARPTGRGLAIVRAVADAVVVDITDSFVTVRCRFERR